VITFPDDIVFPPLQFYKDQNSANCRDDDNEDPEEFANADPDICPIRKRDNIHQRQDSDSDSDASINEPFWEEEEEVLSFDQQEESSR